MPIVVLPFTAGHHSFLHALLGALPDRHHEVTVVASTAADLTAHGLRFSPDLDAALSADQGHSPAPGAEGVIDEVRAYGIDAEWFDFDARALAAALVRTRLLGLGYTPSQVTLAMRERFGARFTVLPLSDQGLESHVVAEGPDGAVARHVRHGAPGDPAAQPIVSGLDAAKAAPGLLNAIRTATLVVLLAPVDEADWSSRLALTTTLALPGVTDALGGTRGRLVSTSPEAFSRAGLDARVERLGGPADVAAAEAEGASSRGTTGGASIWGAP